MAEIGVFESSWSGWSKCSRCGKRIRWAQPVTAGARRQPFEDDVAIRTGRDERTWQSIDYVDAACAHKC
jgi:hypothetical protein